jgi:hypothetical protein
MEDHLRERNAEMVAMSCHLYISANRPEDFVRRKLIIHHVIVFEEGKNVQNLS